MLQTDLLTIAPATHKKVIRLMGNRFEISVVSQDKEWANERIEEAITEIRRIEALLTTFREDSQTNLVNRNAGVGPVKVDREVYDLVQRANKISRLTQGAFDLTYGSVDKSLWNFDQQMSSLPDPAIAKERVKLIDYRNIISNEENSTLFLAHEGMRIGFGGIGKGYAAEMAKKCLLGLGVENGVVNAAGDLTAWGKQEDGNPWTIGIIDPSQKQKAFSSIEINNMSVATSGNYEKYVVIDGKKYSHTIDPNTGMPVHGIKSVTIICPNAEIADALATPVMIMGIKAGLSMIDQLKGVECILIDDDDHIHTSKNIRFK